jgi:hypothetical protein
VLDASRESALRPAPAQVIAGNHEFSFEPATELYVYTMANVGCVSSPLHLACEIVGANSYSLLRQTVEDFAQSPRNPFLSFQLTSARHRCFSSAWHKTPATVPLPIRRPWYSKYSSQLSRNSRQDFQGAFARCWICSPPTPRTCWPPTGPIVPNHIYLLENNVRVDLDTGI